MKKFMRSTGVYVLLLLAILFLMPMLNAGVNPQQTDKAYSEFIKMVEKGEIQAIEVTDHDLKALKTKTSIDPSKFPKEYDVRTYVPSAEDLEQKLWAIYGDNPFNHGLSVTYKRPPEPNWFLSSLPSLIITVLMLGFLWYMMAQQGQGGNRVMNFGKSRAKVNSDDKNPKTFADVAGADEEKEELEEIVDFLKDPKRFASLGARIPKGVLLNGPPGTGKTLLARALAGEAGVPFYSISGSDFVEMFVGVGASRVRDLFDTAKKNTPCIVFIDEIDAVGRHRGAGLGGGHDEREQTLNQLLVEMDGFATNEGIIILAATNRPDILDPALLRPGRFDRQVTVNYPDIKGREEILKVHAKGKPLDTDVDLSTVAKRTPWFTGADLENVLNEAAILTARRRLEVIGEKEILESINRILAGPEKKSAVVTEKDKRLVSFHEAGHAIVAHFLENCDPIHEVSIIPRGQAGGYTMTLPGEETHYITKSSLLDNIAFSMGGRAAEKLEMEDISSGAVSDLKQATNTARRMVVEFGMSDDVGQIYLGAEHEVFVGRDYGQARSYSEEVAARIDAEVKRLMDEAYRRAEDVLTQQREKLHMLADALLEKEKLDGGEFLAIVGPRPFAKKALEPEDAGFTEGLVVAPQEDVEQ